VRVPILDLVEVWTDNAGNPLAWVTKERVLMATPATPARQHRATFARDKRKGGYLIRVIGPQADQFAGMEVPVTRKDNSESTEKLIGLIWSGTDEETSRPVALYSFEARPREDSKDDLNF
jgi:hypothetical protein